jgi:hypothetical protein
LPSLIHVVGVDLAFAAWGAAKNPIEVPGNCRSQKPAIGHQLTVATGGFIAGWSTRTYACCPPRPSRTDQ